MTIEDCYARLDKAKDPLLALNAMINWNSLKPILESIHFESGAKGGRPGIDPVVIVRCLLLQSLYNISDDACEYQINDRLSFKRFVGLDISEKAPDSKTIWLYRERLKHKQLHEKIFEWFASEINQAGYTAQKGQIVDATFVPVHKPTGKHKKQLAEEIPLTRAQVSQIDNDATFTKKGNKTYHGYKNHIQVDAKHKIIRKASVTTASTHDSQEFSDLIDAAQNSDKEVYADSAYRSNASEEMLAKKDLTSRVHERAYQNKPLSEEQKQSNKIKSSIRARVEHVFGQMITAMNGLTVHVTTIARVEVKVILKNLAYNMRRFVFLQSHSLRENYV